MGSSVVTNEQLSTQNEWKLLLKYALPSITAMIINSIYNIVDQIFIGQGVGYLGNAATNVAYPLVVFTMGVTLMFAHGNSAFVNLQLGAGNRKAADESSSTSAFYAGVVLLVITILCFVFIKPILYLFGATDNSYSYAFVYTAIVLIGVPVNAVASVFSNCIKADGNPTYSMVSLGAGAVLNCFLDPLFIFVFKWGVAGGALATIIGQYFSFFLTFRYIRKKMKNFELGIKHINLKSPYMLKVISLGASTFAMRICTVIVNVVLNNTLRTYGAASVYGADIVLAASGIVQKLMTVLQSFVQGLANAQQPIIGFNYGAKYYGRVKRVFLISLGLGTLSGVLFWFAAMFFPEQLISIFGSENALYVEFAVLCLKTKFKVVFIMSLIFITSYFYQAIGKPLQSVVMTLLRQFGFLVPSLIILPKYFGLMGALYAYPLCDALTGIVSLIFIFKALSDLKKEESSNKNLSENEVINEY